MRAVVNTGSALLGAVNPSNTHPSSSGYRRISSLKSSTMSWLKGGNKQPSFSGGIKKKDISSPLPISAETPSTVVTFLATTPSGIKGASELVHTEILGQGQAGPTIKNRDLRHSRVTSPIAIEDSPLKEADVQSASPPKETDIDQQVLDELSAIERTEGVSRGAGKKTAERLKMALSILKRRSNSNLRKTLDGSSEAQRAEMIHAERNETPNFVQTEKLSRGRSLRHPALTLTEASPTTAVSSFNFSNPRPRTLLSKQASLDTRRQRRATVASLVVDDNVASIDGRPSSSQSSFPGLSALPSDDFSAMSVLGPDGNSGGQGGSATGGGLHPRPSSLRRHWSDGAQRKRETSASFMDDRSPANPAGRASQGGDRIRPLSFSGMHGFGNMKITEAASLESRVRELEAQVATLQSFLAMQNLPPPRQAPLDGFIKSDTQSPILGSPFRDQPSTDRPVTASSASTFLRKETTIGEGSVDLPTNASTATVDWTSVSRNGPFVRSVDPFDQTPYGMVNLGEARNFRQRPYNTLESTPGPSVTASKRSTISTVTPDRGRGKAHGSELRRTQLPPDTIGMAEYTGLVAMVKREQRLRKKLEARISKLQEHMSLVLHRQLLMQEQRAICLPAPDPPVGGIMRSDFRHIRKRASSEVPTPDLTPPRPRGSGHGQGGITAFTGFDTSPSPTASEYEDSYMGEPEGSELWETPTEESVSGTVVDFPATDRNSQSDGFSPFTSMQPRTMSISQITERASTATTAR